MTLKVGDCLNVYRTGSGGQWIGRVNPDQRHARHHAGIVEFLGESRRIGIWRVKEIKA